MICCLISLTLTIIYVEQDQGSANPNLLPLGQSYPSRDSICQSNLDWLNELDISFLVNYSRREIVVRSNPDTQGSSITKIDGSLFSSMTPVLPGKDDNEPDVLQCLEPLFLYVPVFTDTLVDASHIIFGAATTVGRLEVSMPCFERWLAHANARLFVVVTGSDGKPLNQGHMDEVQLRMRRLGLAAALMKPSSNKDVPRERYFSLVKILYANQDNGTRWSGFIYDDKFVSSMSALISALDKHDHT